MNVSQVYLRPVNNPETVAEDMKRILTERDPAKQQYLKEPFLVLRDAEGIGKWKVRQRKGDKPLNGEFVDDEPGQFWAVGSFRISDKYTGPLFSVQKMNPKAD